LPFKHDPADCLADFWRISSASALTWAASIVLRLRETAGRVTPSSAAWSASVKERTAWEIGLMPGQPWADIRGMGNRLRHAYDRMNLDVIWNTIREDLPSLAADVQAALERLRPGKPK
jgi:Protein of unknown function DUF86